MARGGHRTGRTGAAYTNRSDLTAAPTALPAVTVPNQPYGMATQQRQAQQAVPMASGPITTPTPPPAAAAPSVLPGSLPPLNRPTERPNEPLTHGAPVGPGAGPGSLGLPVSPSPQMLGDLLNRLAAQNPDLAYLAAAAQGGAR